VRKRKKQICLGSLVLLVLFASTGPAIAKWRWTPETGWYNTKKVQFADPESQFAKAVELFEDEEYAQAVPMFAQLKERHPDREQSLKAAFYHARCLLNLRQYEAAFEAAEDIYHGRPDADIPEVAKLEFEIGQALYNGGKVRFLGMPIISGMRLGVDVLDTAISHYPYGDDSDDALYQLGKAQYGTQKFVEAEITLSRLIREYPDSEWVGAADFMLAKCLDAGSLSAVYAQEQTLEAIEQYRHYKLNYPEGGYVQEAGDALGRLQDRLAEKDMAMARYYRIRGAEEGMRLYCEAAIQRAPDSVWGTRARAMLESLE